jgi:hypothetical protein
LSLPDQARDQPEGSRERKKALKKARDLGDGTGTMLALAQLTGECPARKSELKPKERSALAAWSKEHGRKWKQALREAWEKSYYPCFEQSDVLQRLRNTRGPSWLRRFSLADEGIS